MVLKEFFYCFNYALENPSKTCSSERTYKLRRERNKTERLYIDANKLANVRRDIVRKKRLTDAEFPEIKSEVKAIIKKIKEKVVVTEQPEIESEDKEIFVGFWSEGERVILKECKVLLEDLLCDTKETNDIHNEDQNDDEQR